MVSRSLTAILKSNFLATSRMPDPTHDDETVMNGPPGRLALGR